MNPNQRTCYGVYVISRKIARRVQQEWEAVESPPLPRRFSAPLGSRRPPEQPAPRKIVRPLAA